MKKYIFVIVLFIGFLVPIKSAFATTDVANCPTPPTAPNGETSYVEFIGQTTHPTIRSSFLDNFGKISGTCVFIWLDHISNTGTTLHFEKKSADNANRLVNPAGNFQTWNAYYDEAGTYTLGETHTGPGTFGYQARVIQTLGVAPLTLIAVSSDITLLALDGTGAETTDWSYQGSITGTYDNYEILDVGTGNSDPEVEFAWPNSGTQALFTGFAGNFYNFDPNRTLTFQVRHGTSQTAVSTATTTIAFGWDTWSQTTVNWHGTKTETGSFTLPTGYTFDTPAVNELQVATGTTYYAKIYVWDQSPPLDYSATPYAVSAVVSYSFNDGVPYENYVPNSGFLQIPDGGFGQPVNFWGCPLCGKFPFQWLYDISDILDQFSETGSNNFPTLSLNTGSYFGSSTIQVLSTSTLASFGNSSNVSTMRGLIIASFWVAFALYAFSRIKATI